MRKIIITIFLIVAVFNVQSQDTTDQIKQSVKHFNQVKIGSSVQVDVYYFGGHYDESYYYGYDYYYYPDGPNAFLYIAYEHIFEFPNKVAIGIEPKAGISFREFANHAAIGNDFKFYWTNKEIWRMGIALSTDYILGYRDSYVTVPMDNGNYYQRKQVKMYYHNLSFDIAIIPFQFKLRKVPIIIESQFSLTGLSVLMERSENYTDSDGNKTHTYDAAVYPYFVKGELKIGYQF